MLIPAQVGSNISYRADNVRPDDSYGVSHISQEGNFLSEIPRTISSQSRSGFFRRICDANPETEKILRLLNVSYFHAGEVDVAGEGQPGAAGLGGRELDFVFHPAKGGDEVVDDRPGSGDIEYDLAKMDV